MTELFVSYSRDDSAVIEPIVENLRRLGFDLWIDIEHLTPGTPAWTQAIDEALHRADGVLAFLSPAAKESQWCNIETIRAQQFGKPIYPVLLSGNEAIAVPIHLVNAQYTDMRGRANRERELDQLVQTLSRELGVVLPDFEIDADRGGTPVVQVIISGHVEGHVIAIGGDVEGDVNVAGRDIQQETVTPPPFEDAPPPKPPVEVAQTDLARPVPPPHANWQQSRGLLVGGGIAGVVVLGVLIVAAINIFGNPPADSGEETPTDVLIENPAPEITEDAAPTPTEEVTEVATSSGFEPVTANADWEPHIEEINGVQMALVPPGCFEMGEAGDGDESPVHEVCFVVPFWIDVYEVSNEQYGMEGCYPSSTEPAQPRNCVDWTESADHCETRGARLPTEAEWAYAARGPNSLVYPWGETFVADFVVYYENSLGATGSVTDNPNGASWVGALHMSGNLMEWIKDWYDQFYYESLADGVIDPQGPETGTRRVVRSGSWFDSAHSLRAANRDGLTPWTGGTLLGFRCARSYEP